MSKIYRVNEDNCYNDCKKFGSIIEIELYKCNNRRSIMVGQTEVSCLEIFPKESISLAKGERLKVGSNIFFDYEGDNRIYLDYEKYMNIYEYVKLFGKLEIYGIRFFIDRKTGAMHNNYLQRITKDEISFVIDKQPVLTKEGVRTIKLFYIGTLKKGECKIATIDGLALCYGDP